jgi:hypothetical protein
VAIVVTVGIQLAQSQLRDVARGAPNGVTWDGEPSLSRIAAPAPAAIAVVVTGQGQASIAGSSGVAAGTFIVDVSDAAGLSGWRDLRVEAWRAVDPGSGSPTPVSPAATGPFVASPAVWSPPGELPGGGLTWSSSVPWGPRAMTLSESVRLDGTPWVTAAWVALTGVAPDGSRHLIGEPDYVMATFNGTVLGWIQAAVTGVPERQEREDARLASRRIAGVDRGRIARGAVPPPLATVPPYEQPRWSIQPAAEPSSRGSQSVLRKRAMTAITARLSALVLAASPALADTEYAATPSSLDWRLVMVFALLGILAFHVVLERVNRGR